MKLSHHLRHSAHVAGVAALACSLSLGLAACGGEDDKPAAKGSSSAATKAAVQLPAGVELTKPGESLELGEPATVFWAPDETVNAALSVTVTTERYVTAEELKGFSLDTDYTKNAAFYFVDVTVANLGDGDVGGRDVPLSGVDHDDVLLPAVMFESPFKACPSTALPKSFPKGATYAGCLVFAAPEQGDLKAVTFHPVESIEPIDWPGVAAAPAPPAAAGEAP